MQTLYLICGIPMSGKTAVAREIAERENAIILSYQKIKENLFGPDLRLGNDHEVFRHMWKLYEKALDYGRNIVVDSLNPFPSCRRGYAIRARKQGLNTICVYCHKHYAYAITANMLQGGDKYTSGAIRKAYEIFIPPEKNEGWHEIRVMDGNRYSLDMEGQIPVERRTLTRTQKKPNRQRREEEMKAAGNGLEMMEDDLDTVQ